MQDDLNANYPSSPINIFAINENGADQQNALATEINDLPFLQDVDADSNGNSDAWEAWWTGDGPYDDFTAWRDVHVVDPDGERTEVYDLTNSANDLRLPESYDRLRTMLIDAATSKRVAQSPWQNRVEPLDINNDGLVVPNDALRIINRLNGEGPGELPAQQEGASYFDATGDNVVSARDVLLIVRHLNSLSPVSGEPPSGEPPAVEVASVEPDATSPAPSSSVDAYFALAFGDEVDQDDEDDDAS